MSEWSDRIRSSKARVVLIGLPFDENSSYIRGAGEAPSAIREALFSDSSNLWTENGFDLGAAQALSDSGDLQSFGEIEDALALAANRSIKPICLGGDHSVTYPVVRGLRDSYPRLSILHFDAHPDLYHDFRGNRFSHASPFARIMEERIASRLIQVGIRTMNRHQKEQAEKFGVEVIEMKDLSEDWFPELNSAVYVSMDMDALDPAFAPGVSHPEGGGLSTRQVVRLIQSLRGPLIGADVVELNPRRDVSGITAAACAKIVKELAGKMLETI